MSEPTIQERVAALREALRRREAGEMLDRVGLTMVEHLSAVLDYLAAVERERDALGAWACAGCGCRFSTVPVGGRDMRGVRRCSRCVEVEVLARERYKAQQPCTDAERAMLHRALASDGSAAAAVLAAADAAERAGFVCPDDPEVARLLSAVRAWRERGARKLARLWECNGCGFAFDARHEDATGGFTCPECGNDYDGGHLDAEPKYGSRAGTSGQPPGRWKRSSSAGAAARRRR